LTGACPHWRLGLPSPWCQLHLGALELVVAQSEGAGMLLLHLVGAEIHA
jgi:hypothetical protein